MVPAATSRVTTEPAATVAPWPIVTPGRRVAAAPILASSSIVAPAPSSSRQPSAPRALSLVVITLAAMKTLLPIRDLAARLVPNMITVPSPISTSLATPAARPTTQWAPILTSSRIRAASPTRVSAPISTS